MSCCLWIGNCPIKIEALDRQVGEYLERENPFSGTFLNSQRRLAGSCVQTTRILLMYGSLS